MSISIHNPNIGDILLFRFFSRPILWYNNFRNFLSLELNWFEDDSGIDGVSVLSFSSRSGTTSKTLLFNPLRNKCKKTKILYFKICINNINNLLIAGSFAHFLSPLDDFDINRITWRITTKVCVFADMMM